jgi:DNA polymerase-3 subunit delta
MIEVIIGNNALAVQTALRQRLQSFADSHDAMAVEQYDPESLSPAQLPQVLQALPFLTEKRMVVLKNLSADKALAEKLQNVLLETPESTDVLVVEASPDKRMALFKFLIKQPNIVRCDELDSSGLANWLVAQAKAQNGSISSSDARYLIERLGANQLQLSHELDKLLAYQPAVTRDAIDALTERSPQSTVFELLDAAFSGNTKRAMLLYQEQRAQRVEPQAILGMIAWQLHILALVKAAGDRSPEVIAREAKLSPYVVKKSLGLVRSTSLRRLREWVDAALQLDANLKRKSIVADDAVQHLLLSFATL